MYGYEALYFSPTAVYFYSLYLSSNSFLQTTNNRLTSNFKIQL